MEGAVESILCLMYGISLEFILINLQSPGGLSQCCELEYYTLDEHLYVPKKKQNALEFKYVLTVGLHSFLLNMWFFQLST